MTEATSTKAAEDPKPVPKGVVAAWTAPWVLLLATLLVCAFAPTVHITHDHYIVARGIAIVAMLVLAFVGLLRALDLVGAQKNQPWHTDGFLVALVLFWGLFPPSWFFIEYLLFDRNTFLLPPEDQSLYEAAMKAGKVAVAEDIKARYLASIKPYVDLASKVWVSVGAALGAAIGLARAR